MTSFAHLLISISLIAFMQIKVHSFATTNECIDGMVEQVKLKRSDLSTEFFISNQQTSESLFRICEYFVPHKIHRILRLVNAETCNTKVPTISEFEESIFDSYVQLLDQLKIYQGRDIPNSFGQLNDRIVGMTKAIFDRNVDQLAGVCLQKRPDEIE